MYVDIYTINLRTINHRKNEYRNKRSHNVYWQLFYKLRCIPFDCILFIYTFTVMDQTKQDKKRFHFNEIKTKIESKVCFVFA